MTASTNIGLPFIEAAQAQKHVTHNEALRTLDALVMLAVKDRDLTAPPDSPAEGDRYIVKAAGSGGFAGKDDQVAHYSDGGWTFYPPRRGWTCYVEDEGALLAWDGEAWGAALDLLGGVSELQNLARLGIGTEADATNPLAAKLNNALWVARTVAEGGDGTLRYKLSKESADKTLSILFQDDYSGRAEIGLAGDDDFHFKTSPDGSTWADALLLDAATGATKVNAAFHLTGAVSPATLEADADDFNPAGLAAAGILRIGADAPRTVTGLSGGGAGRMLALVNTGAHPITLKEADSASSAENRFAFGADVVLAAEQSALVWYDADDSRWRLLAGPQATAGGGSGPADIEIVLAELALGLADALNVAQFLGGAGNRFADSFDTLTYVDTAGATNLDSATAGMLKSTQPSTTTGTFGQSSAGGRAIDSVNGQHIGFRFTAPSSGGVISATLTCNGVTTPGSWEARVYADSSGSPGSQIGSASDAVSVSTTGDKSFVFASPPSVSSGTVYWIVVTPTGGAPALAVDTCADQGAYQSGRNNTIASLTNNLPMSEDWRVGVEIGAGGAGNLEAASTALAAASAPSSAKIVARVKFVDSITLGTDLMFDVSRDGGTTWTNATMNDRFTGPGSLHVLESDTVSLSAQPGGTDMKWRVRTDNDKMVEIHDIYLYWS